MVLRIVSLLEVHTVRHRPSSLSLRDPSVPLLIVVPAYHSVFVVIAVDSQIAEHNIRGSDGPKSHHMFFLFTTVLSRVLPSHSNSLGVIQL